MAKLESWDEVFRPRSLDDLIDVTGNIEKIKHHLSSKIFKHYLLLGPAGTGKTTAAKAIAREWLKQNSKHMDEGLKDMLVRKIIELNASDERGIEMVRKRIKTIVNSTGFYVIILDEADAMTPDAQQSLRRIMEKAKQNPKSPKLFILTGNFAHKIIDPIQSRCEVYNFPVIPFEEMRDHLIKLCQTQEINGITFPHDALTKEQQGEVYKEFWSSIYKLSKGDMRRAINKVQGYVKDNKLDMSDPPLEFEAEEFKIILDTVIKPINEENSFAQIYNVVQAFITNPDRSTRWQVDDFMLATIEWAKDFSHEIPYPLSQQLGVTIGKYGYRMRMGTDMTTQLSTMICEMRLARMLSALQENEAERLLSIERDIKEIKEDLAEITEEDE